MLHYEFLNKEWVVSATAYRVYRFAASLSVVLFVGLLWALSQGERSSLSGSALRTVAPAAALATGTTFVGMEYFLFRFDNSHPLKQVLWFCIMIFPFFGPALYCFVVYSRTDLVRTALQGETLSN
jgi:hypothetical protein